MRFVDKVVAVVKDVPVKVWLVSVVMPGGIVVVGAYVGFKSLYKSIKHRKVHK